MAKKKAAKKTPAAAKKLGVPLDDTQATDSDGTISFDKDTARDLWRHSYADRFMLPVMRFSREMLEAIETEKALAKNGYGGSLEHSTAH